MSDFLQFLNSVFSQYLVFACVRCGDAVGLISGTDSVSIGKGARHLLYS